MILFSQMTRIKKDTYCVLYLVTLMSEFIGKTFASGNLYLRTMTLIHQTSIPI